MLFFYFFLFDHFLEARAKKCEKFHWCFGVWGDTKISYMHFFLKILMYCQKLLKKSDIIFRCSYGVRFFVWIKDWLSLRYVPWFMFDIKSVCPLLRPIMTLALTFINGISSNSCSVFLSAMVFKVMVPLWNIQCSNLQRNTV